MSDLISRQAVLEIINKVIIRYDELKPKYELIIIKSAMEKMADEIVKDLEKLPSVEPEWNPELREFIEKVFETLREMDDAVDVICNLDVDAVLDRMEVTPNE